MNAGYTWFLWRGEPHLEPAAGHLSLDSIAFDLAGTPIWIGLLSVLLGTTFIRKAFAEGTVRRPSNAWAPAPRRLPVSIAPRAALTAIACAVMFALPLSYLLPLAGDGVLTLSGAIGTKVVITIAFGLMIVPFVVCATARDTVPEARPVG